MDQSAEALDPAVLEALFDATPGVVFFMKDRSARYVRVNQTLVQRCGAHGKEDLLGKTVLQVFPVTFGRAYLEQDRRVLREGVPLRNELELHLYARGVPGWCLTTKMPLRDAQGGVTGLVGLSMDLHTPADVPSGYQELSVAVAHVQAHFSEPLRMEELARMASLSLFQFEQRMKRVFQLTAGQFVLKTRLDAACDLLRGPRQTITDVALACGFYDQSAFSRQFKATTGLTPGAYRARAHATPAPQATWT